MTNIFKHLCFGLIVVSFTLAACSGPAAPPVNTPAPLPTQTVATAIPLPSPTTVLAAPAANQGLVTSKDKEFWEGGIMWMDNLKTCTPYSRSYLHPFLQVQQNDTIKGQEGDTCLVTQETAGKFIIECRLNAAGIKTLTRDELYQQIKSRTMSGGISDPSTDVLNAQCKLTMLSTSAAPVAPTPAGDASMSNPASVNCTKQGGDHLTIEKRGDGGEFGVCWFEDARQCEEWALLRGECPVGGLKVTGYGPQGRYCAITGGQYTVTGGDMTNEQGTCAFKNSKQCDGADYFNGKCSP